MTSARERARAARLRVDADRARRDEAIETAAAGFFAGLDERAAIERTIDELRAKILDVETGMGAALTELASLGESAQRQRDLLGLDESERRRLRDLARTEPAPQPSARPAPSTDTAGQHAPQSAAPDTAATSPTSPSTDHLADVDAA